MQINNSDIGLKNSLILQSNLVESIFSKVLNFEVQIKQKKNVSSESLSALINIVNDLIYEPQN